MSIQGVTNINRRFILSRTCTQKKYSLSEVAKKILSPAAPELMTLRSCCSPTLLSLLDYLGNNLKTTFCGNHFGNISMVPSQGLKITGNNRNELLWHIPQANQFIKIISIGYVSIHIGSDF